jgi:flavin reductase (DIM6/NTAB) family NADH-FMN oxidoreductase RutF
MKSVETLLPAEHLREYRSALGTFGTGVAVVTAHMDANNFGMTINSFASVSLHPALVLWSVGHRAAHCRQFCAAERFAIHILGRDQRALSDRFAVSGGDKFAETSWSADQFGVPRIAGCLARFSCRTAVVHPGGDHEIIVGEVEAFEVASGEPLLFVRGEYVERLQEHTV